MRRNVPSSTTETASPSRTPTRAEKDVICPSRHRFRVLSGEGSFIGWRDRWPARDGWRRCEPLQSEGLGQGGRHGRFAAAGGADGDEQPRAMEQARAEAGELQVTPAPLARMGRRLLRLLGGTQ